MGEGQLHVGFYDYDHTRRLLDGTVAIDGVKATFATAPVVAEIFERMIRDEEFDVAELGLTYYLRVLELKDPPFIALPVFLARLFRHSSIYVNAASGIRHPHDLAGKTIGEFAIYGHDAGVWAKGILAEEYGASFEGCRWIVGGLDWPLKPIDFIPQPHPDDTEVTWAPPGTDLGQMLEDGEIDALFSANVPKAVLEGSPKVVRLFADHEVVEREYFRRTGIFPIMHTVVARRELVEGRPDVARAIYRAFCEAKDAELQRYRTGRIFNQMTTPIPWLNRLVNENSGLLSADWWPYGVAANRTTIEAFLRYHVEQGLSTRRLSCEDIFLPELLAT